ncbi:hypothetical protein [Legionella cherrii]|uniref:Dot/Icm secretion system substrate n=1 Tax=Legionella cherrii TaxID=28084 RepID=A0A0W0S5U8_9GAMM|nr:hypothetical protein [Legionella cherrii]KTC78808.1 substrate of the Dot/Icm secretion system [Legionella cherrii]VEB35641.1 Dot/Icm secretion system substrate [Legionella cherrii]
MPTAAEKNLEEAIKKRDKLQKIYENQVVKNSHEQKMILDLYATLSPSSKRENIEKFRQEMELSNTAAHDTYLAKLELNEAKMNVAEAEYKKAAEDLDIQRDQLAKEGKLTDEKSNELNQKREEAHQKYKDTKELLEADSQKAYDSYAQIHKDNTEKYTALINPEPEMTLSAPGKTQTVPTVTTPLPSTPKKDVTVASPLSEAIFKKFQDIFKDDPWYKNNPSKQGEDGKLNLSFKSESDMNSFFQKMAAEQKDSSFLIVDSKTNQVMGYGDKGKLYHANGEEFKSGDKMKPGGTALDSFKIPEPKEPTQSQTLS